jgi:hypothetical protein
MKRLALGAEALTESQRVVLGAATARPVLTAQKTDTIHKLLGRLPAGGSILLPEGIWYVQSLATWGNADVRIRGEGWKTIIRLVGGPETYIKVTGARVHLENLVVEGHADSPRATGGLLDIHGAEFRAWRVWLRHCFSGVVFNVSATGGSFTGGRVSDRPWGGSGIDVQAEFCAVLDNNLEAGLAGWDLNVVPVKSTVVGNRCAGGAFSLNPGCFSPLANFT